MDDDDLPLFRPRFGTRRVRADDRSLRSALLSRLPAAARRARAAAPRTPRAHVETHAPTLASRRVVVKARFVKLTAHGAVAAALHLKYIQRDGVERDGSPGVLYGPSGQVPTASFEQPRLGEEHQFRFIVSPEDAGELDLTAYVRRLMRHVEKDLGRDLEWAAVNHYNTEHPHAHVVVRGVDRDGHAVRFDRQYMARGFRERAQELATEELGPRTPEAIERTRQREITQERFTSLDQELERRAEEGRVARADLEKPGRTGHPAPPLVARLEHLEELRLAERVAPGTWTLMAGWKDRLRELGERQDIQKQMHAAVNGDPARYRQVRPGQPLDPEAPPDRAGAPALGRIRAKALGDELRGTFCAIVETADGAAYHVPLDPRTAASCRVGDCVTLSTVARSRVRPEDAILEAMARTTGGLCAPRRASPRASSWRRRRSR
jgi:type IV secretory pathway VirD2 relaxase